jgi:hypothetical protein
MPVLPSAPADPLIAPVSPAAGPLAERGWGEPETPPVHVPLRCRLGLHSWLSLALSVPGSPAGLSAAFCRCCPAVRQA